MPDFDATEGYNEAGNRRADTPAHDDAGAPDPAAANALPADPLDPRLPAPVLRRSRHRRHPRASSPIGRRVSTPLLARRRRAARRACPYGWQVRVLGGPRRKRRHLWTECHRQASGSQS